MSDLGQKLEGEAWLAREWQGMLRRLVAHIETGTADLTEEPSYVPASSYTDMTRFAAERRVFLDTPLLAGLSVEIPEPGDRLLFDEAGPPIIVVRVPDGSVKAYLNICPHRGSRLVNDCRSTRSFQCPFHAWLFSLDGMLLRRPRADGFEGASEPLRKLIAVPVAEWAGLIFVSANPGGPDIDVRAFLDELAPVVEAMELEKAALVRSEKLDVVETNWKLAMDTFCESYHVPAVHGKSLGDQVVPYVTIDDLFGTHGRYIGPGKQLVELVGKPEAEWPKSHYSAVHYIFPNTTFTYTDSIDGETPVFTLFRLFPGREIGQTDVLFSTFRPKGPGDADDDGFSKLHDELRWVVENEDFATAANTWRSLRHAPTDMKLTFGRNEVVLQNYHRELAARAGMPLDR